MRKAKHLRWGGGLALAVALGGPALAAAPDFGPHVTIFDPSMTVSQIQSAVDAIATQQIPNQFGAQRYALLFKPGNYGASGNALNFQVGYYTSVAGLGRQPTDVVVDGSINVYNQCDSTGSCVALNNFWRSLSNLSITTDNASFGCHAGEFWAVSQASPLRRVSVNSPSANITLMDYCSGPSYASGGFIADSAFNGTFVNGSQQQWFTRDSSVTSWTNGVWNQVFAGVTGAPATCFPAVSGGCGPYTTLPTTGVTREAPYLYVNSAGDYYVLVPGVRTNAAGTSWAPTTPTAGRSLPIKDFYIAKPTDPEDRLHDALARGLNLILTPGVYALKKPLRIERPDTVVLGLGFPTLVPQKGEAAIEAEADEGVEIASVLVDAGPVASPYLVRLGAWRDGGRHRASRDPSALFDVFVRVGGATAGSAGVGVIVNSDGAIIDDLWAWRADHGAGVGWTLNKADSGLIVNGDNVSAYGLAVEHFQKAEVIWNGDGGTDVFFQNEMPYDPPSQSAWQEAPGVNGYPAFKVDARVRTFNGYGMGSYSFFNQGVSIFSANAFEAPKTLPAGSFKDLLTVFLDPTKGSGGISNVIDGVGGSSTAANPSTPVTVTSYP